MIKINLAPAGEFDSPLWWVPDAVTFVVAVGAMMLASYLFLSSVRSEIDIIDAERVKLDQDNQTLKADVDRYAALSKEITELQRIKDSYSRITETKLARYLPIIILEHLQNLKPQGVWFTRVNFLADDPTKAVGVNPVTGTPADASAAPGAPGAHGGANGSPPGTPAATTPKPEVSESRDHMISLTGNALNNVILGEFMTLIQATENQEFDPADLRSQAFFKAVNLGFSKSRKLAMGNQNDKSQGGENASVDIVEFEVRIPYNERVGAQAPINMKLSQLLGGKRPVLRVLK